MSEKTELQKVGEAACVFIYGKYELDEIANGKDTVLYCDGDRVVFGVQLREEDFNFLFVLNEAEREKFEAMKSGFPQKVTDAYEESKKHDGKWIWIPVADFETLDAVKTLMEMKMKPNRKPFPKETAVYARCGSRCDLCVHYEKQDGEFRKELMRRVGDIFGEDYYSLDTLNICPGCLEKEKKGKKCGKAKCPEEKGYETCAACPECPCSESGVIGLSLQAGRSTCARSLTYAILPYVGGQCGN